MLPSLKYNINHWKTTTQKNTKQKQLLLYVFFLYCYYIFPYLCCWNRLNPMCDRNKSKSSNVPSTNVCVCAFDLIVTRQNATTNVWIPPFLHYLTDCIPFNDRNGYAECMTKRLETQQSYEHVSTSLRTSSPNELTSYFFLFRWKMLFLTFCFRYIDSVVFMCSFYWWKKQQQQQHFWTFFWHILALHNNQ